MSKKELICSITQDCDPTSQKCGHDLYFVSGYVTGTMKSQLANWNLPNRRIFECDTNYDGLGHDLDKVVKRFQKGVRQNGDGKFDLLGYSWGGFVVQEFAQRYPERVNKIVLINASSKMNELSAAALKFLAETGIEARIKNDYRYHEIAMDHDFTKNNISAPTFTYNCAIDSGNPPIIKGARNIIEMCVHDWSRSDSGGRISAMVREFLDGES